MPEKINTQLNIKEEVASNIQKVKDYLKGYSIPILKTASHEEDGLSTRLISEQYTKDALSYNPDKDEIYNLPIKIMWLGGGNPIVIYELNKDKPDFTIANTGDGSNKESQLAKKNFLVQNLELFKIDFVEDIFFSVKSTLTDDISQQSL